MNHAIKAAINHALSFRAQMLKNTAQPGRLNVLYALKSSRLMYGAFCSVIIPTELFKFLACSFIHVTAAAQAKSMKPIRLCVVQGTRHRLITHHVGGN